MEKTKKSNVNLQFIVLLIGVVLMGGKFAAWYLTHSNAILTDALESIINVVAGTFTLYSLWLSAKPRDREHPYGHGKIEFISAGVEGAMIFIAGIAIISKSVYNILYVSHLHDLDLGIYISVVTGLINFLAGYALIKRGTDDSSLALIAGGKHLQSDAYSTAGMIVGLLLIYFTNEPVLDSVVAIIMGIVIVILGIRIVRKSLAGILDETDEVVVGDILSILNQNRKEEWIDIHNLRVIKYGTTYHIDCHATLPWYYNQRESHDVIENIASVVEENCRNDVEFFIHTDPCQQFSCTICSLKTCTVRKGKFTHKINWSATTLLTNQQHGK